MDKSKHNFLTGLEYVARTDIGMRRANNQDSHAVVLAEDESSWQQRGHLFVVADGMGAHAAGELASQLAAEGIPHLYHHYRDLDPPASLERSISETNAEIHRRGQANPDFHAMGTTASTLVLLPEGAVVGHVGDSRVYRLRNNNLEQLTFDHSLVWELQAAGQMGKDTDLAVNVPKNVITRSLGPHPSVVVDLEGPFPMEEGDIFLLCSDGLSGQVEDAEIGAVLASLLPAEAASVLIDLANLRGGPDNITLIVAKIASADMLLDLPVSSSGGSSRKSRSSQNPTPWIVTAICLFAAIVLWLAKQPAAAIATGVAGLIAFGSGVFLYIRQKASGKSSAPTGKPLGKGPHTRVACKPDAKFIGTLAETVRELREAATEDGWNVDWPQFDRYCDDASEAGRQRQYAQALRDYGKAISFMMDELRNQQNKQASDSSIEY